MQIGIPSAPVFRESRACASALVRPAPARSLRCRFPLAEGGATRASASGPFNGPRGRGCEVARPSDDEPQAAGRRSFGSAARAGFGGSAPRPGARRPLREWSALRVDQARCGARNDGPPWVGSGSAQSRFDPSTVASARFSLRRTGWTAAQSALPLHRGLPRPLAASEVSRPDTRAQVPTCASDAASLFGTLNFGAPASAWRRKCPASVRPRLESASPDLCFRRRLPFRGPEFRSPGIRMASEVSRKRSVSARERKSRLRASDAASLFGALQPCGVGSVPQAFGLGTRAQGPTSGFRRRLPFRDPEFRSPGIRMASEVSRKRSAPARENADARL